MKKKRLIPVLLLKDGSLVQSKQFTRHQNLGNPFTAVKRLSNWASDELIYLDISRVQSYSNKRTDLNFSNVFSPIELIREVSKVCFMPITFGGGIRTLSEIELIVKSGADKVSINTAALKDPNFIRQAAKEFGSQCIIVSVDVKLFKNSYFVMSNYGKVKTNYKVEEWCKIIQDYGAGEILLNSVDNDGMKTGYDIKLIKNISKISTIPVIALGGVGDWKDFAEALEKTSVDAVAAANIFHYYDQSVFLARKFLSDKKLNIRKPELY